MATDRELVSRIKQNDTRAFDALYWKYHSAVYRNIYKLVKDHPASTDILQEVFYTLWDKRLSVDEDKSVSGWLFVLSFNKSINFLREKLKESLAFDSLRKIQEDDTPPSSDFDQLSLVQIAIDQLPPQKQKVVTLCKVYGKSYEETAGILNISKHTVKEYLSGAMASIKEFVKQKSNDWDFID